MVSYWYCPNCKIELDGCHVTYEEKCEYCGSYVLSVPETISQEELDELIKAKADGRLVVLPVKVGDAVYQPFAGKVYEKTVDRIIINRFTTPQIWIETKLPFAAPRLERWDLAIGKTVFLTKEEAERALERSGQDRYGEKE